MMLMTNTFVNDEKHERATAQSKVSKTFLGINFYQSFYSVYGKSLGCELLLMHCYHHEDLSCQSVSKSLKTWYFGLSLQTWTFLRKNTCTNIVGLHETSNSRDKIIFGKFWLLIRRCHVSFRTWVWCNVREIRLLESTSTVRCIRYLSRIAKCYFKVHFINCRFYHSYHWNYLPIYMY